MRIENVVIRPKVVVVGAGAAGTMAAIFAAAGGAETVLLERTPDGGRKILISGGGRCNILPSTLDEPRFVTDSSRHTLRNIVRSWPLREQIAFFEGPLNLPLVEEPETGKLFPRSQRARDVRDTLIAYARHVGVRVITGSAATDLMPTPEGWSVILEGGDRVESDAVVLATGGLSVPMTGSDGVGLRIAEALGHVMHRTYPALTPLTADVGFTGLSGVSLRVSIVARSDARSAEADGGFLFTHRGYSGPAVLDVSHVAVRSRLDGQSPAILTVCWTSLDDVDWERELRAQGSRTVLGVLSAFLPRRLAEFLAAEAHVDAARPLAQLRRPDRRRLIDTLVRGELKWSGDEGYKKAEVTGGGVSLAEIDPKTMESRRHPRLFLCGEMLDAFGPIGGYNFLWAWVTGRAAGQGAGAITKYR